MMGTRTTLAAVLVTLKAPLELHELEIPPLQPGQVLVKIAYSGLCHSQLNEIAGRRGEDRFLPHTLGHEGSGIIEEVGPDVKKVRPGERIVLSWLKGSGREVASTLYVNAYGQKVHSGAVSTFLERAVVSENRVVKIPDALPLREAALLGCALPTGAGVVFHEMGLEAGASFAIFGVGGVGMSALLAAKQRGATPLIAVDVKKDKLEMARRLGATHLIHAGQEDPGKAICALTEGNGVDFAFESAGKREAMEKAFASIKAPGGLCVLAGNLPLGEKILIDPFELIRGKRLIGTWGGKSQIERDVAFYTELYLSGQLDLTSLITHQVTLKEIHSLLKELEAGNVGRGLIQL